MVLEHEASSCKYVFVVRPCPRFAEASCVSQIKTAAAVAHDMGEERAISTGVQLWAKCGLQNSERDVHRVLKKQKIKLDIPVETMSCDGVDLPWISPESWLKFIVKNGLWPVLAGCNLHDYGGACCNWSEFWRLFELTNPNFELFNILGDSDIDLSRTAAFCLHGDEGRTLKHSALMVCSLQSALGRGFDEKRVGGHDPDSANLRVNYAGHSFTTRYVLHTLPKSAYDDTPEVFHEAVTHIARSLSNCLRVGFLDETTGNRFRIVLIAVKGDAPFLGKVAHFYRGYNTSAKRGEERGQPKGICPYCLAGTRSFPAEELATLQPAWRVTEGVKLPWVRTPSLVKYLLHDRSNPASLFKSDIWHMVHLGFGRSFIASVVQLVLQVLPLANLDLKWDFLTEDYLSWCSTNRKQAHVSKITPYLMSYNDSSGAMGNWHKGALTANFGLWLVDLLGKVCADRDRFLVKCRMATYRMNALFSTLYRAGAFLTANECAHVSQQGLSFLSVYSQMAEAQFQLGRQWLFPLYPKLHVFHHVMLQVRSDGVQVSAAVNPLLFGCQIDEDCIGKASRLSRRVNIRQVATRSLDRYLVAAHVAFSKAGLLS